MCVQIQVYDTHVYICMVCVRGHFPEEKILSTFTAYVGNNFRGVKFSRKAHKQDQHQ